MIVKFIFLFILVNNDYYIYLVVLVKYCLLINL